MIYAERGNRVKQISENDIEKYVGQGYKIVDDNGKVIKDTIPTDVTVLQTAYEKHTKAIEDLTAENTALKAELEALKAKATAEVKTVADTSQTDATPKKTRKKSDVAADATE